MKAGSFFCGIGGFDKALESNGIKVEWVNEICPYAIKTYKANFNNKVIEKDIAKIEFNDLTPVDIVSGGFPCQPFSTAGKQNGFNDSRGTLVFELYRLVKEIKPKVVLLENVSNILFHNKGKTFQDIIKPLHEMGYHVKYKALYSDRHSNTPQTRKRVFIVAFKNHEHYEKFTFPNEIPLTVNASQLLETNVPNEYYVNIDTKVKEFINNSIVEKGVIYQYAFKKVQKRRNNSCPTLLANMKGTGIPLVKDNKGIRVLTQREFARFQGFSESFIIPNDIPKNIKYKIFGNSVTIPLVERIVKQIKLAMD